MAHNEMHLVLDVTDAKVHIAGYVVFRPDRSEGSHYGVAMCIKEHVIPLELMQHSVSICRTMILIYKTENA